MHEIFSLSARALASLMRRGDYSPVEVVERHIQRIEAVNGALNALVAERFDQARQEARDAADLLARRGQDLPPLLGVPCTVKEFFALPGMPNSAGLWARRAHRATSEATAVARLRRAGAIVLGVSNGPDGGMWVESSNQLYGRTNNPWNVRRTSGGSSGGEAALVGAGASALGLGSDIAGSIRIPAAFCGVPGHKPTARLVSNQGHWGPTGDDRERILTVGPLGRTVGDLRQVLGLLAGPDGRAPFTRPARLDPTGQPSLDGLVVYPVVDWPPLRIHKTMRRAVERAAEALQARGAEIRELEVPLLSWALPMWCRAMDEAGQGGPTFCELLGDGQRISPLAELLRMAVGRPRLTLPAVGLAAIEEWAGHLPPAMVQRIPSVSALGQQVETTLGTQGVILAPPYSRPAPRHGAPLLTPFDHICAAVFSILEFPATAVPVGCSPSGLPVGVQIAGIRGNDGLTLSVATALEAEFGRWRPVMAAGASASSTDTTRW
jgi:fatty acid amide hydrolase 2